MPEAHLRPSPEKKLTQKQWDQIKDILGDDFSCLILLTCETPTKEGEMPVEMTVEGDKDLAQLLLLQAPGYMSNFEGDCYDH